MQHAKVLQAEPDHLFQEIRPPGIIKIHRKKLRSLLSDSTKESVDLRSKHPNVGECKEEKVLDEATLFNRHNRDCFNQDLKQKFVARWSRKSWCYRRSVGFEKIHMEWASQQTCSHHGVNQEELGKSSETCQSNLSDHNDFLDAIDFLQFDRDYFLRYIKEPYWQHKTILHEQRLHRKHKKTGRTLDLETSGKDDSEVRLHERCSWQQRGSKGERLQADLVGDKSSIENTLLSFHDRGLSPGISQKDKRPFATMNSHIKISSVDCYDVSRIVVLKPCAGKVKDHKYTGLPRFPLSRTCLEDSLELVKDNSQDVFHELREPFRAANNECKRESRKHATIKVHDYFRDGQKDPQKIARQIAKQVRQNVARGLSSDFKMRSNNHCSTTETCGRNSMFNVSADPMVKPVSRDEDESALSTRLLCGLGNKSAITPVLSHPLNPDALHTHRSEKWKRRVLARSKMMNIDNAYENQVNKRSSSHRTEYIEPICVPSETYCFSNERTRTSIDHSRERHVYPYPTMDRGLLLADSVYGWDGSLRSKEDGNDNWSRTLLRSRSVTMDSDKNIGDSRKGRGESASHTSETVLKQVRKLSVKQNSTETDVAMGTMFTEKLSDVKGRLVLNHEKVINELPDIDRSDIIKLAGSRNFREPVESISFSSNSDILSSSLQSMKNGFVCKATVSGDILEPSLKTKHIMEEQYVNYEDYSQQQSDGATDIPTTSFGKYEPALMGLDCEDDEQLCVQEIKNSNEHSSQNLIGRLPRVYDRPNQTSKASSEVSEEKLEQPSPVSVFDFPSQEITRLPVCIKQIRHDLHGSDVEPMLDESGLVLEDIRVKLTPNCLWNASEAKTEVALPSSLDDLKQKVATNTGLQEEAYSTAREPEMLYVGAMLFAFGFASDDAAISTKWYASNQPFNPSLFEKTDDYCLKQSLASKEGNLFDDMGKGNKGHVLLGTPHRRLLFDCVNERILQMLDQYLNQHPWLMSSKLVIGSMPIGKEMMKLIPMEVYRLLYLHSTSQDTLEKLVFQDLFRNSFQLGFIEEMETVGIELEKCILNDLINEIIINIIRQ